MSQLVDFVSKTKPDGLYKLMKIQVKNEESRAFNIGDTHVGQVSICSKSSVPRLHIGDAHLSDLVSFSQNGEHFVIETKNSVYSLEKLD